MISSANDLVNSSLHADLCIVGSGAAGITLALALIDSGLDVLLLESGDVKPDATVQALYAGEVADAAMHSPPDRYRQRRFGGSTTIWGGRCVPYDPIDFEPREYIAHSGWPIDYDEVARHYAEATRLCEAGEDDYCGATALGAEAGDMFAGFTSNIVTTNSLERFSLPTNFGARYRKRLKLARNVRILTNANCIGIRLRQAGNIVNHLDVSTLAGKKFLVTAKRFVLATGGLETPRLLLSSTDVQPNGIGNENDIVGRYYMCHIAGNVGELVVNGPIRSVRHGYEISPEGIYCRRRIALVPDKQKQLKVGNLVARLHFPDIVNPVHRSGILSGLYMAKFLISYEYGKRLHSQQKPNSLTYVRHLGNIISDPLDTIRFLSHWMRKRVLAARKFPSVILPNKANYFSLDVNSEQVPNPESRVTLSNAVDALGMRRIRIDWRYSRQDIDTVERSLATLASELRQSGVGQLHVDNNQLEAEITRYGAYGGHHIGTTRMGTDPHTSVVNPDCRIHGVDNLYIASSAVFPTSSQANPTLTVVAMALRLALHLKAT